MTKYFCEKKKIVTIGMMAIDRPAITAGQSEVNSLVSSKMPTGSVFSAGPRQHEQRQQELVPDEDRLEDRGAGERRAGERQDHPEEGLDAVAIVEPRRVFELLREIEEEGVEEHRREGDAVGGVGQHDREPAVQQAGGADHLVQRHQHAMHRHGEADHDEQIDPAHPGIFGARKHVGRHAADDDDERAPTERSPAPS